MLEKLYEREFDFESGECADIPQMLRDGHLKVKRFDGGAKIIYKETFQIKYTGEFNFTTKCIEGKGKYNYESGASFEGEFVNNSRTHGTLFFNSLKCYQTKNYQKRNFEMMLPKYSESRNKYTGYFKNDLPHGTGNLHIE